jgi:hypothetical protein
MRKFEPAPDYDGLRKQAASLYMLCNSLERQREHWRQLCDKLTREMLTVNKEAVQAELETNEQLTNALEIAEREIDRLRALVESNKK